MDRNLAHLSDMLGFVDELEAMLAGQTLAGFTADRMRQLAVEKLFLNLGEAASRIDPAFRAQCADLPWRQMIGLRNLLAHGYEQVAQETLFKAVQCDLPALVPVLRRLLSQT